MAEKQKRLSPEELEDLEIKFMMQFRDELHRLEYGLVSIYSSDPESTDEKLARCNDFIETTERLKEFCKQHGPGGNRYYNEMVKGDPRLDAVKSELKFIKKYPNGPTLENAILEIHKYLKKEKAATIKDISTQLSGLGALESQALKLMVKIEAICLDDNRPKVYYLPTGEGRAALAAIRGEQATIDEEIEQIKNEPEQPLSVDVGLLDSFAAQLDDTIKEIENEISKEKKNGLFGKLLGSR